MIKRLLSLMLLMVLSACAQKPVIVPDSFDYRDQLSQLGTLENWEVSGRMSIQTNDDAFSASFNWRKLIDYQRIEITGMLGQTYAILEISPDQTLLTVRDQPPVVARDVDALMWSQLGFTIPVALLTDWIKAYPTRSTEDSIRIDGDGFIETMSYQGWEVTYKRYKKFSDIETLFLPSRTTVTNSRETIKLAIKAWQPL